MPPPGDEALPAGTASRLQAVLNRSVVDGGRVGVTAAVVTADGTWAGAAGVDGVGGDLQPTSAMSAASITKTFVAAEVMHLVGEGAVGLDSPVEDYLSLPFDGGGATVREVLGMRSGYPFDPVDALYGSLEESNADRHLTAADVLALVDPSTGMGVRGGTTEYNNLNYVVLGMLVEQVTAKPLADAIREDLLGPAKLDRVWLQDRERPQPPLARAIASRFGPPVADTGPYLPSRAVTSALMGTGGIAADAPSLARWGYLLYGGHVIDAALVAEMVAADDKEDFYGLGTGLVRPGAVVGHGGDIGVYHSTMLVWIKDHVSVAVLVPQPASSLLLTTEETATRLHDIVASD